MSLKVVSLLNDDEMRTKATLPATVTSASLADAIARQNLGTRQFLLQSTDARIQATAAKGAERHNLLAAQVCCFEEGGHGRCVGAIPNGKTEEFVFIRLLSILS